jgi:hypothetical protein
LDRFLGFPAQVGVGIQAQIVVRGEVDDLFAINDSDGLLLAGDDAQRAVEMLLAQAVEFPAQAGA